jgi:membrane protein required for colicin V production
MIIDLLLLVLLIIAVVKGVQRGLIVALFSLLAWVVGLAAALKLSTVVAGYLKDSVSVSAKWLPILSFLIVFVAVVLIIRIWAKILQTTIEIAWLGGINKIGGAIFYVVMYVLGYSVWLFFFVKMHLIEPETIASSISYSYIKPLGPMVIDGLGKLIPLFKDLFGELESFFENLSQKIPHSKASM